MKNYFQGSPQQPFHISIGAVLRNEKGEICCHYFKHFSHPSMGSADNFYILMRETIEPNETIETVLARGLSEEWGAVGAINSYLGSLVTHHKAGEVRIQKTTLYFLCDLVSIDTAKRRSGDEESSSEIIWMEKSTLITAMKEQGVRIGREDLDESAICERLP